MMLRTTRTSSAEDRLLESLRSRRGASLLIETDTTDLSPELEPVQRLLSDLST